MKNYHIYYKDKTIDEFTYSFLEACKSNNKDLIDYLWNENNEWKQYINSEYIFLCLKNLVVEDNSSLNILFDNTHLLFCFLSSHQKKQLFQLSISFENWNNLELLEKNIHLSLIDKIFIAFDYINHNNYDVLDKVWNLNIDKHINDIIYLTLNNNSYKINQEILLFIMKKYKNLLSKTNLQYLDNFEKTFN